MATERMWIFGSGQPPFVFDTVVRESHSSDLAVTDNPVETGVVVSDHAIMQPARLDIEAYVGAVSFRQFGSNGQSIADVQWLAADAGDESSRFQRAYQLLLGLQASAEPFDVQTGLKLYQSMVVTSISADQDVRTARCLRFRASLREVIRISTKTVTYPPRHPNKPTRQASKTVTSGEKQATPVMKEADTESALFSFLPDSIKNDPDATAALKQAAANFVKAP